jgi:hypothetical protein
MRKTPTLRKKRSGWGTRKGNDAVRCIAPFAKALRTNGRGKPRPYERPWSFAFSLLFSNFQL